MRWIPSVDWIGDDDYARILMSSIEHHDGISGRFGQREYRLPAQHSQAAWAAFAGKPRGLAAIKIDDHNVARLLIRDEGPRPRVGNSECCRARYVIGGVGQSNGPRI